MTEVQVPAEVRDRAAQVMRSLGMLPYEADEVVDALAAAGLLAAEPTGTSRAVQAARAVVTDWQAHVDAQDSITTDQRLLATFAAHSLTTLAREVRALDEAEPTGGTS